MSVKSNFFFVATTISRPAVGPIQLPIQWVPGDVLPGGKAEEAEVEA